SLGLRLRRATILRASSNGQAFELSATSRRSGTSGATSVTVSAPAADTRNRPRPRQSTHLPHGPKIRGLQRSSAKSRSERADRKISQPQIGETTLFPHPEQRPVQRQPDDVVALL